MSLWNALLCWVFEYLWYWFVFLAFPRKWKMPHICFLLRKSDVLISIHVQCPCLFIAHLLIFWVFHFFIWFWESSLFDWFYLAILTPTVIVLLRSCLQTLILRIFLLIETEEFWKVMWWWMVGNVSFGPFWVWD